MKQKRQYLLYTFYILIFLADCYATRISQYSCFSAGSEAGAILSSAATLSLPLGCLLAYLSAARRSREHVALAIILHSFYTAFFLFRTFADRILIAEGYATKLGILFQTSDFPPVFAALAVLCAALFVLLALQCREAASATAQGKHN